MTATRRSRPARTKVAAHRGRIDLSDLGIQTAVFRALGSTAPDAQRLAKAVTQLVHRFKRPTSGSLPSRHRVRLRNAAERRRVLERLEKGAFALAGGIAQIEGDSHLSYEFEQLFRSSVHGKPPGFPETGLTLADGDLGRQFLETLALAYAARHIRGTWRATKKGRPAKTQRNAFLQQLAREYEKATGVRPLVRKRDSFADIVSVALPACGFHVTDVRDAIASALSAPASRVQRIQITVEPRLREVPNLSRGCGRK